MFFKNICNKKASSIKSSNKDDVPHVSIFAVKYIPTYDKKSKLDRFCSVTQVVLAIMSILSPVLYYIFYEYRDSMYVEPVQAFPQGWVHRYSRYSIPGSQTVAAEDINNDDEYGIGEPIVYCDGLISLSGLGCDEESREFGALTKYKFRLKNKTKQTIVISDISAVIEKNEMFKPREVLVGFPQGVEKNAQYGFDLNSRENEIKARELNEGDRLGSVLYGENGSIALEEKKSTTITVALYVPPARKIDFRLEISFDNPNYPTMIIKNAGKPFSVVSYPDVRDEGVKSYVKNNKMHTVPCKWSSECFWFLAKKQRT